MSLFFGILSQTLRVQVLHRRATPGTGSSPVSGASPDSGVITMMPFDAETFFVKSLPIWDPKILTVAPPKPNGTKIPPPTSSHSPDEPPFQIIVPGNANTSVGANPSSTYTDLNSTVLTSK